MWNVGLPYKLKQLIDLVAQRNYLFTYDGKQYGPLLHVEKAIVVYTRGSRFLEGTSTKRAAPKGDPECIIEIGKSSAHLSSKGSVHIQAPNLAHLCTFACLCPVH
jgi:hypothetical protein